MFGFISRFFKRRKPIVINCYTYRPDVFYHAPIVYAKKTKPKWFSNLPKKPEIDHDTLYTRINMRHCTGVSNFITRGIVIPLWSTFRIELSGVGSTQFRYRFADEKSNADYHDTGQRGEYLPEDKYQHIKMISPWSFTCDEDVDFISVSPYYYQDDPFEYTIMTGVLNFMRQPTTNVNLIFNKSTNAKIVDIEADTPIMQLIPLSDRNVEIRNHLVTVDEYNQITESRRSIRYFNADFAKSQANPNRQCPFNLGRK